MINRVRRLHGQGLNDVEIGQRLGLRRDEAHHIRYGRLRLPPNEESILRARRRGVVTQFQRLGIRHGGDLRRLSYQRYAAENGWPEDLRPREVQILNVLAAQGVPMTRLELSAAIGMRTREDRPGHLAVLSGNGPGGTYTATLMRRGFIAVIKRGRTVSGQGKGRSVDLYYLGPRALAILEERARADAAS